MRWTHIKASDPLGTSTTYQHFGDEALPLWTDDIHRQAQTIDLLERIIELSHERHQLERVRLTEQRNTKGQLSQIFRRSAPDRNVGQGLRLRLEALTFERDDPAAPSSRPSSNQLNQNARTTRPFHVTGTSCDVRQVLSGLMPLKCG